MTAGATTGATPAFGADAVAAGPARRRWRLGVDARRLLEIRTGVARIIQNVLAEWSRAELPFDEVLLFTPRSLPADVVPRDARFRNVVLGPALPGVAWEQIVLPARAGRIDVLFSPSDTVPVLARVPRVAAMHAYSPEMAASFTRRQRLKWEPFARHAARHADAVISPCRSILATMEQGLGVSVPPHRVRFAPLAADARFHPRDASDPDVLAVRARYGIGGAPYAIFVGKLSRRRHIPELLGAFADVRDRIPHRLVLGGPNHLHLGIDGLIESLSLADRVVYHSYVADEDLPPLYSGADLFLLASEGEGFSLTTLEAMQSGVPVITLDRPNMVEVTAGGARLIPDGRRETLAAAILEVLGDAAGRCARRELGFARTRELTWANTARAMMDVLWDVAQRAPRR